VLLFGGDAGLVGARQVAALDQWLGSLPVGHALVTFGNVDSLGPALAAAAAAGGPPPLANGTVLSDSSAVVRGWRVLASPWTPAFAGVFQLEDEGAAAAHWERLLPPLADVDILVTHGPPHGTGDASRGRHVGDRALAAAVQALRTPPLLWVVGHIHEAAGSYTIPHAASGRTITLINAAVARGGAPFVVDLLPSGEASVSQPPRGQQRGLASEAPAEVWVPPPSYVV